MKCVWKEISKIFKGNIKYFRSERRNHVNVRAAVCVFTVTVFTPLLWPCCCPSLVIAVSNIMSHRRLSGVPLSFLHQPGRTHYCTSSSQLGVSGGWEHLTGVFVSTAHSSAAVETVSGCMPCHWLTYHNSLPLCLLSTINVEGFVVVAWLRWITEQTRWHPEATKHHVQWEGAVEDALHMELKKTLYSNYFPTIKWNISGFWTEIIQ